MTSSFNGIEELEVNNQIAKRIRADCADPYEAFEYWKNVWQLLLLQQQGRPLKRFRADFLKAVQIGTIAGDSQFSRRPHNFI